MLRLLVVSCSSRGRPPRRSSGRRGGAKGPSGPCGRGRHGRRGAFSWFFGSKMS